ncbi:hypothetical protein [Desulfonatronum parangueonense]
MKSTIALCMAVWLWLANPALAGATTTGEQFLQGTGTACLVGGAVMGVAALSAGPTVVGALTGGTMAMPASVTTTGATLLGCSAGAAVAVTYYSINWVYETFFRPTEFPLLYPPLARDLNIDMDEGIITQAAEEK